MKDVFSVRRSADSDEVLKSINGLLVKVITPAYDSNDITLSDKDYRLVMGAASNSAHTLTIAGSFIGLGVDAGVVMPLTGTDIVIAASDFKKGDYLNFVCDGTNWFVEAQFVTADAATVS